jgi:hypothetical protein
MSPAPEPAVHLSQDFVDDVVDRIRRDRVLGRGSASSWEAVAHSDYEARERVRHLIEDGVVRLSEPRTPRAALKALREFENAFFGTESPPPPGAPWPG